jgi:hypothetical protein
MKRSVSAAIGAGIISLNLVMLPLALPASAQNSDASGGATTSDSSTKSDPSNWGLVGLVGLLGLAAMFRRPRRASVVGTSNSGHQANVQATGDRLQAGLAQVGESSHNLLDEIKTNISDFQERRAQEKEIKQIKNALGRPSKRVILDRQDNVILNVGDLITNQAIERARVADMLDVLLNSVDEGEPEIESEERIAPVAGEASLEKSQQVIDVNRHQHQE